MPVPAANLKSQVNAELQMTKKIIHIRNLEFPKHCDNVYMTARGGLHQPTHINKWNWCAYLINTDKTCEKGSRTIE